MRIVLLTILMLFYPHIAQPAENMNYAEEIQKWRAAREESLRADNGWLTLAGRYPLKDGANTFGTGKQNDIKFSSALAGIGPESLGTIEVDREEKRVTLKLADGVSMLSDGKTFTGERVMGTATDRRDWVALGRLSLHVIERNGTYILRLADNESLVRKNFPGCVWYASDEQYKVEAKFVAYAEKKDLAIVNIINEVSQQSCPGYAEFELHGKMHRLDAIKDGEGLFFVFRDGTSGDTTYPPARFLDVDKQPESSATFTLDFNKAYNPPCAFSEYTTCPLPPKQNILKTRIEAGEKYRNPD